MHKTYFEKTGKKEKSNESQWPSVFLYMYRQSIGFLFYNAPAQ